MLLSRHNTITCVVVYEEALDTTGRIPTLYGLIVDADFINSKLQPELPCSIKWTKLNSQLTCLVGHIYIAALPFSLSLPITPRSPPIRRELNAFS